MVTLVLVRHAKSDWGSPDLDDHDRPLNDRGRRDAPRMAQQLAASGFRPDAILASTALRAATTAGSFAEALGTPVETDPDLYGASGRALMAAAVARGVDAVLVVAHDPGMTVLAAELSGDGIGHMPTCAVARFDWDDADWEVASATPPTSWSFDAPR